MPWRPPPLVVPASDTKPYMLTQSGTFREGDLSIGRAGLIIGQDATLKSRLAPENASAHLDESRQQQAQGFQPQLPALSEEGDSSEEDEQLRNLKLEELEDHGLIGSGSSGLVRKVVHLPTGRPLVLKVMQFDVGNDTLRKQITMELRTLYDSHHAFIVRYYQAYFEGGCIIVVMEFMDGGTLAHLLSRLRTISELHIAELARQALLGLDYLHKDLRVIHRDIKPSNLLLNSSGILKISDFGVSGHLDSSVSQAASWVGTVTYMSPERIQGASYSFSSDIWSLGLTLLEAALGRFPYPPNASPGACASLGFWDLLAHIVQEPCPVPPPGGTMSAQLCNFLSQALAKEPTQRPSAAQLLAHPFLQRSLDAPEADVAALVRAAVHSSSLLHVSHPALEVPPGQPGPNPLGW